MKIALDTNILAYAEGVNGAEMQHCAQAVIENLPSNTTFVPVQVLGELFAVLTRKAKRSPDQARSSILGWQDAFHLLPTTRQVILHAMDLAGKHGLSFWDSVILSAAAEEGCRFLLSEDLQSGFTRNGTTIVNPFHSPPHPLFEAILSP